MIPIVESIFKAYDIRGRVDEALTETTVELIGKAFGTECVLAQESRIVVGRDGRLSSARLQQALLKGLSSCGLEIIDVGEVTTPMVYFATEILSNVGACAVITGSHNPPEDNGIKMVIQGQALYGDAILGLLTRIRRADFVESSKPKDLSREVVSMNVFPDYCQRIVSDIQLKRPLKVVVDAGNGVAGAYAPKILRAIGCEVVERYCEVDGRFPNHHPDPAKVENLQDLIETVKIEQADLGIALDGDGDRCGVVDNLGLLLYPDRQLMLYARDVLSRQPGAEILYDIKCSSLLAKEVNRLGGRATLWKTGHSLMKAKMRETGAALGGEVSGHMFFKERWYGFDDGIYTAARLLEIISAQSLSAAELFDGLPDAFNTPELEIPFKEGQHYRFMQRFLARAEFDHAEVITLDGIRVNFKDGWGLVRPSNTTSVLVCRFEGDSPDALARIERLFKQQLLATDPTLQLPF